MSGRSRIWYARIEGEGVVIVRAVHQESATEKVEEILSEEGIFNSDFEVDVWPGGESGFLIPFED